MKTEYTVGAVCTALGLLLGLQGTASPAPAAASAKALIDPPASACTTDDMAVSATPGASVSDGNGGSSLRFNVHAVGAHGAKNSAAYSLEVLDSSYRPVTHPVRGHARSVAKGDALDDVVQTPALPDGYYVVRISASIADGKAARTDGVHQYIHVQDGEAKPITVDEWDAEAGQNGAI